MKEATDDSSSTTSLDEEFEKSSKWRVESEDGACVLGLLGDRLVMSGHPGGSLTMAPVSATADSSLLGPEWVVHGAGDVCWAARTTSMTVWVVGAQEARQAPIEGLRNRVLEGVETSLDGSSYIQLTGGDMAVVAVAGERVFGTAPDDPFVDVLRNAEDGALIAGWPTVPGGNPAPFWYVVAVPDGMVAVAVE